MAPREGYELIEDRLISGLGVLQIPQEDTYRAFRIWVDVVRLPDPDFFNGKWNPARSEYAKITYMTGKYVWREEILKYLHQVYDYFPKEPGAFLAPYLVCSLENIQTTACQILAGGGWGACVPGDLLYVEPVRYEVDFIRFACREETALQVRLYGLKEDVGCTNAIPNPKRNVEPPDPLPIVPSGDAIEVSAPYASPNDDGNTIPYEGDVLPPLPPTYLGINTIYRTVTNCSVPPEPLTFVWEEPASPVATLIGSPICGDSPIWSFSPVPDGIIFGGAYFSPVNPTLYNGGSYFQNVDPTPVPVTLP